MVTTLFKRYRHVLEYFLGGGLHFISGFVLFAAFYSGLHTPWWLAKGIGDVVGAVLNYLIQRYYTFQNPELARHEITNRTRYILFCVVNLALDYLIVGVLKEQGISPYIGMLFAAVFFSGWNYVGYRFWVFRRRTM